MKQNGTIHEIIVSIIFLLGLGVYDDVAFDENQCLENPRIFTLT